MPVVPGSPQDASVPDLAAGPGERGRTAVFAGLIIFAGVALHAGSLASGFFYDDYLHQYVLRGYESATRLKPWSLYDFLDGRDVGSADLRIYIWWMDPTFKARFLRPVTSMSIWLDHKLFGDWAPGYHLTSLLLFALLLLVAFRLYRDLGAPAGAALWALAFLALEDNHVLPVEWIANRNSLLSALFVAVTMMAVHRSHISPHRWGYVALAAIGFVLALGAKESGIMVFPLTVLYLWFLGEAANGRPFVRRV